jgi:hypothetical protein
MFVANECPILNVDCLIVSQMRRDGTPRQPISAPAPTSTLRSMLQGISAAGLMTCLHPMSDNGRLLSTRTMVSPRTSRPGPPPKRQTLATLKNTPSIKCSALGPAMWRPAPLSRVPPPALSSRTPSALASRNMASPTSSNHACPRLVTLFRLLRSTRPRFPETSRATFPIKASVGSPQVAPMLRSSGHMLVSQAHSSPLVTIVECHTDLAPR